MNTLSKKISILECAIAPVEAKVKDCIGPLSVQALY